MLVVKIELWSAVTHAASEIGRMYIANDGEGTIDRGNYTAAVCRRGSDDVPRELWDGLDESGKRAPKATRSAKIADYPRLAYNVWRLIARSAVGCFPEERAPKGTTPQLDASVLRGLQRFADKVKAEAAQSGFYGIACSDDERAAFEWLDAAKRDDLP